MAALRSHAAASHPHTRPSGSLAHRPPAAGGREFPAALLTPPLARHRSATPSTAGRRGSLFSRSHTPEADAGPGDGDRHSGPSRRLAAVRVDRGPQTQPVSTLPEPPRPAEQRTSAWPSSRKPSPPVPGPHGTGRAGLSESHRSGPKSAGLVKSSAGGVQASHLMSPSLGLLVTGRARAYRPTSPHPAHGQVGVRSRPALCSPSVPVLRGRTWQQEASRAPQLLLPKHPRLKCHFLP